MSYNNSTNFNVFGNYKLGTIVASAHVLRDHPVITTLVIPDDPAVETGAPENSDHELVAYTDPPMLLLRYASKIVYSLSRLPFLSSSRDGLC
jgi:hypothetical protein